MATASSVPFVSVEEYLHTVYEPDMDYVDGVLEDRNAGEFAHGLLQAAILFALARYEDEADVLAITSTRTQTQTTRFRVPDVALISTAVMPDRIVRSAPLVCIEVMSPEDRLPRMKTRCMDYLHMGVPAVWIFDATQQTAYVLTETAFTEVRDGLLRVEGTPVEISVQAIFATAKKRAGRLG